MLTPQSVRQALRAHRFARVDGQRGQYHAIPRRQGRGISTDRQRSEKGNPFHGHRSSLRRPDKSVNWPDTALIPLR